MSTCRLLLRQLKSGEFCDIFFRVCDKDFDLHAVVLACRMGNYIKAHYDTGRKFNGEGQCAEKRIHLKDFPGGSECFEQVYKFCYEDPTFSISLQNAVPLHYAAEYFGMVDEGNLAEQVKFFLEMEVFGRDFYNFNKTKELFKIALEMEKEYRLPNNMSQQCIAKLASLSKESTTILLGDFEGFLDLTDIVAVTQEAKYQQVPSSDISSFVAKVALHRYQAVRMDRSSCKRRKSEYLDDQEFHNETLKKLWKEVDVHLLHENLAATLIDLDEHFLHTLSPQETRLKLIEKFLGPQQQIGFEGISLEMAIHFSKLSLQAHRNQGNNNNDCASLVETYRLVILMLIEKIQRATVYLPPSLSSFWVCEAGVRAINGKYTYSGDYSDWPTYSKVEPDGAVFTLYFDPSAGMFFLGNNDIKHDYYFAAFDEQQQDKIIPSTGWKVCFNGIHPPPALCCATYL